MFLLPYFWGCHWYKYSWDKLLRSCTMRAEFRFFSLFMVCFFFLLNISFKCRARFAFWWMKMWLIPQNKTRLACKEIHLYHVWKILSQTDWVSLDKVLEKNYRCIPVPTKPNSELCSGSSSYSYQSILFAPKLLHVSWHCQQVARRLWLFSMENAQYFLSESLILVWSHCCHCKVQVETVALLCICQTPPLITESGMINMRSALMWVSAWTPPALR